VPFLFSAFYIAYPSKMQEYVPEIPKEFRERLKNGNLWIMENAKEKVILPMTVLKRFDDILAPTKEAVVKKAEELQAQGMIPVLDKVIALLYYDSVS
jgi:hypothetical protein